MTPAVELSFENSSHRAVAEGRDRLTLWRLQQAHRDFQFVSQKRLSMPTAASAAQRSLP